MALVNTAGKNKRFKSNKHISAYYAKRRKNKDVRLGWAWKPPKEEKSDA